MSPVVCVVIALAALVVGAVLGFVQYWNQRPRLVFVFSNNLIQPCITVVV